MPNKKNVDVRRILGPCFVAKYPGKIPAIILGYCCLRKRIHVKGSTMIRAAEDLLYECLGLMVFHAGYIVLRMDVLL